MELEFCPKCGSLLMPRKRKSDLYLVCHKCGYSKEDSNAAEKYILRDSFPQRIFGSGVYESPYSAVEPGADMVEFQCNRCKRKTNAIRGTILARRKLCIDCYRESRQGEIAFRDKH